ncbi:hypothetical protein SAMN04487917_105344 [Arthrobacter sp. yr096]|uniref:hypothetical protein n=1 Tax=Arthrobacter sp. yr096 TaxID=1761750 RepID=UPI0008C83D1F|nr:hypothetical protein [Arthrobacter sp. yr096]SEJ40401.1 hypothetical protein SAMN04487917_105344 [Arthrobacter sp. yr096]
MTCHRSNHAKYVTLAVLALALTLTACSPTGPDAGTSITSVASEEFLTSSQPSAEPVEEILPSTGAGAPAGVSEPVRISVPAPTQAAPVIATPVSPAPVPVPTTPTTTTPTTAAKPAAPAPVATAPSLAPVVTPVAPLLPATPQTGSYTFPDGHISFELPAGWSAEIEQGDYNELAELPGGKENSLIANIYNAAGDNVARITSGATGGNIAGPVNRTILDSQKLTSFDSRDGASYFAMFKDDYPFDPSTTRYFMGVVTEAFMTEGPESHSANSFLIMGNGVAQAMAHIDVTMSPESAASWMESEQYSNLRSLLTSLHYTA